MFKSLNKFRQIDYLKKTNIALIFGALILIFSLEPLWGQSDKPGASQHDSEEALKNKIESVRLWHSPDKTRVVLDVSADIRHKMFTLSEPERLVIDLENASLETVLPTVDASNDHLGNVRIGFPRQDVLRFVFELKKPLEAHSFVLTPNELYGHRLVLDLIDRASGSSAISSGSGGKPESGQADTKFTPSTGDSANEGVTARTNESLSDEEVSGAQILSAPQRNNKLTIAIDAGHGGEDPGALGHRGAREKKITLSIAKHLKKVIDADDRMQAILVREGDYYVDLTRRRTLAREKNADIFVSIHADAFIKKSANGLSVFALSQRGATSAMARALAKKENAADLIGGVSLADKDKVLAQVLVDLSMTNTISESVNLGGRVLKELSKVGRLHSKRVEQASFVVLKSPDIPSILVETGFITNLAEERKLKTSQYQKKIAKAIYTAIGDYYEQTPYYSQASYSSPSLVGGGSKASQNSGTRTHRVKRGDSLSSIALKYGTTVAEIKRLNRLKSNVAVLGRKLKLPGNSKSRGSSVGSNNSSSANNTVRKTLVHVVSRGDSLSKISARYNVTIRAIKRANKLSKDSVYLGQRLTVPSALSNKAVSKPKTHKVKRGDTLSEIAEKYNVSIKALMKKNNMRNRVVKLGQTLKIPQ